MGRMPALIPTDHLARIVWIGTVPDRNASLRARPADVLILGWGGPEGEAHGGVTRPSCSRVAALHPRGTEIANARQVTIVSRDDLDAIAADMGIEALDPALLGATLVIEGVPDLSHVPPSSRLQGPDGATLVVDMANRPCHLPAREIDREVTGAGAAFKVAARGRRGVTAWVERPGALKIGDGLRLFVPDQPAWPHLPAARGAAGGKGR